VSPGKTKTLSNIPDIELSPEKVSSKVKILKIDSSMKLKGMVENKNDHYNHHVQAYKQ